jgi:leucyl aminopeptidase
VTSYALRSASPAKTRADVVVVGVLPGEAGRKGTARLAPGGEDVAAAYGRRLAPLLAALGLNGKPGEVATVPTGGTIASSLLVLVGLGPEPGPIAVRRAAGDAARAVANAASVAVALPGESPELVRAAVEGMMLGGYTFTDYRSRPGDNTAAEIVVLSPVARRQETIAAFEDGRIVAEAVAGTRDWVNTPPGDLTPPAFADAVAAAVKATNKSAGTKLKVDVADEDRLAELGCGGILGVGQGSAAPPRLVEIGYHPAQATAHLALVGKGITFDSGGLSIKPGGSMTTMKSDMAGAAAVVQATLAIARLGLPVRVTAFAAMAENMISGSATRPGDVLTMYDGTTVEIANTDAEGRLVLADALSIAGEREPDLVVDIATLTGHMVQSLGDRLAGVLGDDDTVQQVLAAARSAGEDAWPMPIHETIRTRVRSSTVADLSQHDWVRWGGGLFAAEFLRNFTGDRPWAHLDIAGPAFVRAAAGHWPGGATGYGVATLVELARSLDGSEPAE